MRVTGWDVDPEPEIAWKWLLGLPMFQDLEDGVERTGGLGAASGRRPTRDDRASVKAVD
jgi:hypothetical protein